MRVRPLSTLGDLSAHCLSNPIQEWSEVVQCIFLPQLENLAVIALLDRIIKFEHVLNVPISQIRVIQRFQFHKEIRIPVRAEEEQEMNSDDHGLVGRSTLD